jgi:glycosyltransferase involved in cell wall biosynthesis
MTFALVMPTLNEIEGLRYVLPKIDRSLFKEIIVVDGHSTDGTPEFCREQGLTVVFQPKTGIPDAEEAGFKVVTADALILFTPDGNSLAEVLPAVCDKLSEGYDIVVASRYAGGARSDDDDFLTALGNRMFTATVNFLFRARFTDVLVGFRAYTADSIRRMRLPEMTEESWFRRKFPLVNSWELAASIRAARLKLKVAEFPADEPKRIGGVRKLSIIRNGFGGLSQIIYDFFLFWPTEPPPSGPARSEPK